MNVGDLISRSELVAAIKRQYCTNCNNYNGVRCRACHADDMLALVDDSLGAGPRWISVEERLPISDEYVLCWYTGDDGRKWHTVGELNSRYKKWILDIYNDDYDCEFTVTHWMPLPEPPKED